jgi:tetratricopeptide (TPR) repeat protein
MKLRIHVLFASVTVPALLFAQHPEAASAKVSEGVEFHDKGDYKKAIKKYDEALDLDKDNLTAMAEKAMTLNALGELEKSAALCQEILEKHDGAKEAPMVYVTYGNCMDQLKRPEASLRVYEQGIAALPKMGMLHFNKGITLYGMDSVSSALKALQRSARLSPFHPGTQSVLARILKEKGERVPAMMAFCRFLVLEQKGPRAKENLTMLRQLLSGNVKSNKDGGSTIYVDAATVQDPKDTLRIENDFRHVEMVMSVSGGLGIAALMTEALAKEGLEATVSTELGRNLDVLADLLREKQPGNTGFYWDYYAPWFYGLKEAGHMSTLCNLALLAEDDKAAQKWIKENDQKVSAYFTWEKEYSAQYLLEKRDE